MSKREKSWKYYANAAKWICSTPRSYSLLRQHISTLRNTASRR